MSLDNVLKATVSQNPTLKQRQPESRPKSMTAKTGTLPENLLVMANTPDSFLDSMAKQEAYSDFQDSPTRKLTTAVGTSIPFIDTFMSGAMHKGSSSSKIAKSAGTGANWGVFTGAILLYRKALGKVYNTFPTARKFREDHPTASFIGEVGSAWMIGETAVKGANKGFKKLSGNREVSQVASDFMEKRPKLAETVAKIFSPVEKLAGKMNMSTKGMLKSGVRIGLVGLIVKNVYDVAKTKNHAEENLAEYKDKRYEAARDAANFYAFNQFETIA